MADPVYQVLYNIHYTGTYTLYDYRKQEKAANKKTFLFNIVQLIILKKSFFPTPPHFPQRLLKTLL
jgi:hypothetical protein